MYAVIGPDIRGSLPLRLMVWARPSAAAFLGGLLLGPLQRHHVGGCLIDQIVKH